MYYRILRLVILHSVFFTFRTFVSIKDFAFASQLRNKGKNYIRITSLAMSWWNIVSIFAKRFEFFRQFVKFGTVFHPENKRTSGGTKNNSGNQVNPINHAGVHSFLKVIYHNVLTETLTNNRYGVKSR